MKKTAEEIREMAYNYYGRDINSYGAQRDGFLRGYETCQKDYANQFKPKWISVEDELPKHKKSVLTYDAYAGIITCYYNVKNKTWYTLEGTEWGEVNYWVSLPEKPEL